MKLFGRSQTKVPAVEAERLAEAGLLLDVREPSEWAAGHAPRARHIPLGELERRLSELPAQVPIVTACRSGHRSAAARRLLTANGFDARNLTGGMHAWAGAGLPVVDQRGKPGRIV